VQLEGREGGSRFRVSLHFQIDALRCETSTGVWQGAAILCCGLRLIGSSRRSIRSWIPFYLIKLIFKCKGSRCNQQSLELSTHLLSRTPSLLLLPHAECALHRCHRHHDADAGTVNSIHSTAQSASGGAAAAGAITLALPPSSVMMASDSVRARGSMPPTCTHSRQLQRRQNGANEAALYALVAAARAHLHHTA
jgi:hypothetical protein